MATDVKMESSRKHIFDATYRATGLEDLARTRDGQIGVRYLDVVRGAGDFGPEMARRYTEAEQTEGSRAKLTVILNGTDESVLKGLKDRDELKAHRVEVEPIDVARIDLEDISPHAATVGYALAGMEVGDAESALKALYNSINPGGRLVVVDVVAFYPSEVKKLDDALRYRRIVESCYEADRIFAPLEKEWHLSLANAGFENPVTEYFSKTIASDLPYELDTAVISAVRSEGPN